MGRRSYDDEFKEEACRLVVKDGRSIRSVEESLGITDGVLKDWVLRYRKDSAASCNGKRQIQEEKVRRLEKELFRVTRERDILKKAVAIFSKEPNPYSGS
jgi:transposase